MKRTYSHFVWDILENARDALEFTTSVSKAEFFKDRMRYKAVERCITVIGEAAKRIPKDLQERFPEIPWSDMARTRDKVIHHYDGVDIILMYSIVVESLPLLIEPLQKIVDILSKEDAL